MPTTWILSTNMRKAALWVMDDNDPPRELFHVLRRAHECQIAERQRKLDHLFELEIVDLLKRGLQEGLYDWLVVIAPDPMMTRLIYALDAQVFDHTIGMLRRDASRLLARELKKLVYHELEDAFKHKQPIKSHRKGVSLRANWLCTSHPAKATRSCSLTHSD